MTVGFIKNPIKQLGVKMRRDIKERSYFELINYEISSVN